MDLNIRKITIIHPPPWGDYINKRESPLHTKFLGINVVHSESIHLLRDNNNNIPWLSPYTKEG